MGALIPINPQLPAAIRKLAALANATAQQELSGGVQGGFPVISYKGKVWRVREGGEEQQYLDQEGNAMPTIDIVMVQANPTLSKIFYEDAYVEGNTDAPDCFSNQGDKPDASVQKPVSRTCAVCPKNVWGSKISEAGKKLKACQDNRRVAVAFADDLYNNAATPDDVKLLLMRIPPASLGELKDYQEKVLGPKGLPFFGLVTRVGFDPAAAYPSLRFKAQRFLNEDEAEAIVKLRGGALATRILAEAQEYTGQSNGTGELTEEVGQAAEEEMQAAPAPKAAAKPAPASAPAPATKPAKAALRPASEEEAGAATLAPTPAAKPKSVAAAAKPAAAKAKPKPEPEPEAEVETVGGDADIDSMLDSILNS